MKKINDFKKQDEAIIKLLKIFVVAFLAALALRYIPLDWLNFRKDGELTLAGQKINFEYAKSESSRIKGLVGRSIMDINSGMLFVFPKEDFYPFTMKGMLIPIDIIFIDKDYRIVDLKQNQNPCKDEVCEQVISEKKFKYVLELNSDWVKNNNVKLGDSILINK